MISVDVVSGWGFTFSRWTWIYTFKLCMGLGVRSLQLTHSWILLMSDWSWLRII